MPEVPLAARLAAYRLTEEGLNLRDVRVDRGQQVLLSRDEAQLGERVVQLQPQSADQLKAWIGVPDEASRYLSPAISMRRVPALVTSLGAEITPAEHAAVRIAAHNYVFGPKNGISQSVVGIIDEWIKRVRPPIHLFPVLDIYVSAGGQLIIGPDIYVLFARYITVEETGTIQLRGTSTKIDCAGFKSVPAS